jgi:hypothetical protein
MSQSCPSYGENIIVKFKDYPMCIGIHCEKCLIVECIHNAKIAAKEGYAMNLLLPGGDDDWR